MPPRTSTGTSRSLERGLAILSPFDSDRPLIGVSELSRDLALSRSTAHRYFTTLAQLGYLQQDRDSKRYRLGPRVLDLGFSAINSMDVREIAAPHLRELATRPATRSTSRSWRAPTSSTSSAAARRGPAARDRPRPPRGRTPPGLLHGHGEGDPGVPSRRPARADDRAHRFRPARANTLTDPGAFREELARIRASGIALNDEELAYGLR